MTRLVAIVAVLALAGCASSKVTMRTMDGDKSTGGAIAVDGPAPAPEGAQLMDGVCGKGKWKVTKEEQAHPNELGNIAATSWAKRPTLVCL